MLTRGKNLIFILSKGCASKKAINLMTGVQLQCLQKAKIHFIVDILYLNMLLRYMQFLYYNFAQLIRDRRQ